MKFYFREGANMPLRTALRIPWVLVQGNNQVVATESPEIQAVLDKLIAARIGGVSAISEVEFTERKKNLVTRFSQPRRPSNLVDAEALQAAVPLSVQSSAVAAAKAPPAQAPKPRGRWGARKTEPSPPTTAKGVVGVA